MPVYINTIPAKGRVYAALVNAVRATANVLQAATGLPLTTVYWALGALEEEGHVVGDRPNDFDRTFEKRPIIWEVKHDDFFARYLEMLDSEEVGS
jgi:sugar-specific transcriptional regulator TrmB